MKKIFSLFLTFVMCFALMSPAMAKAQGNIGIIDTQKILQAHPDMEGARQKMQLEEQKAKQDYEDNAKDLPDAEKQQYIQKLQQQLAKMEHETMGPIGTQIDAAIKKVAEVKGLTVVFDKGEVITGGTDITEDVVKEISKNK